MVLTDLFISRGMIASIDLWLEMICFVCERLAVCLELEEVVRLLKSKGIRLHRDQSEAGAEDDAKRKLYASYLKKKKHQTERHVLRKEMAEHAIPQLFVSQRSDKNPYDYLSQGYFVLEQGRTRNLASLRE